MNSSISSATRQRIEANDTMFEIVQLLSLITKSKLTKVFVSATSTDIKSIIKWLVLLSGKPEKILSKVALFIIRGKSFSVFLSARKVTFNIKSRKCDPRHVGQFGGLQNHSNFQHFGFLCREKISMSVVTVFKATSIYHDASIRPYNLN